MRLRAGRPVRRLRRGVLASPAGQAWHFSPARRCRPREHRQTGPILRSLHGMHSTRQIWFSMPSVPASLSAARWRPGAVFDLAAMELKTAYAGFDACGARLLARRALSERHRLSASAPRANSMTRGDGLAWLSRREAQVASLVAEGLTNRRIAQRLFVTEKTIEMHMSNIFSKLGVPSRAAVASAVTQADAAAQGQQPAWR